HLLGSLDDHLSDRRIELAEFHIHFGGRALDDTQCANDRGGLLLPTDPEIAQRALRLRPPVTVGGNLDRPERIGFGSGLLLAHDWLSRYMMERAYRVAQKPSRGDCTGWRCKLLVRLA